MKAERKPRKWVGAPPQACDICKGPVAAGFVDGATVWGPWAIMCFMCHFKVGRGLGLGIGQKYNGALEKIGG